MSGAKGVTQAMAMGQALGNAPQERQSHPDIAIIPPHLIAEALAAKHGGKSVRWSGPITPDEMSYVEDYVKSRYPEALQTERVLGLAPLGEDDDDDEDEGGDEDEAHGRQLAKSPSSASKPSKADDIGAYLKEKQQAQGAAKAGARANGPPPGPRREGSFWGFSSRWLPSGSLAPHDPGKAKLNPGRLQEIMSANKGAADPSMSVHEIIARNRVLKKCGVDAAEYHVVFCASGQEALLLVGEAYPFHKHNVYLTLLPEATDSISDIAAFKEAKVIPAPTSWLDLRVQGSQLSPSLRRKSKSNPKGLFAYPYSAGFHSLNWITEAQRNLWHVLLDASDVVLDEDTFDLGPLKPDYVVCVSPKIVGYPTRVTCLLVRRESQLL